MTDTLPSGVTFVSVSSTQGTCIENAGVVTCNLNDMDNGASANVTIVVTAPDSAGTIINSASVASSTTDPDTSNNSASEDTHVRVAPSSMADLSITKTDSRDPVYQGSNLVYTIEIHNDGPQAAADIEITDILPAALEYRRTSTIGWSCSYDVAIHQVTCTRPSLAAGMNSRIFVYVKAGSGATGTFTNSAHVSSSTNDPDPGNNQAYEQTTIESIPSPPPPGPEPHPAPVPPHLTPTPGGPPGGTAPLPQGYHVPDLSHGGPGDGYPDESLEGMATDSVGNIYLVGYAYNGGDYDIHVLKYDANGNLAWHQVMDSGDHDYGYGIAVGQDDSIYVSGYKVYGNTYRGVLLRYATDGSLLWSRDFSSGRQADTFYNIAVDGSGLYAVGETYNGHDFDALIVKFDFNGSEIWHSCYKTPENDTAYAIGLLGCETDDSGAAFNCRPVVGGAQGRDENGGWLVFVDPADGQVTQTALLAQSISIFSIAVLDDNDIFIGSTTDSMDWSLYLVDSGFNIVWNALIDAGGKDVLRDLAIDRDGFLYGVGRSSNGVNQDVLIAAFDPFIGQEISRLRLDNGGDERGHAIAFDSSWRLFVAGQESEDGKNSRFLLFQVYTGKEGQAESMTE